MYIHCPRSTNYPTIWFSYKQLHKSTIDPTTMSQFYACAPKNVSTRGARFNTTQHTRQTHICLSLSTMRTQIWKKSKLLYMHTKAVVCTHIFTPQAWQWRESSLLCLWKVAGTVDVIDPQCPHSKVDFLPEGAISCPLISNDTFQWWPYGLLVDDARTRATTTMMIVMPAQSQSLQSYWLLLPV